MNRTTAALRAAQSRSSATTHESSASVVTWALSAALSEMNGTALTIVGVAEAGFYGASLGEAPDVWLPLMMQNEVRYVQNVTSYNGETGKPWPPQENLYWLRVIVRAPPPASEPALLTRHRQGNLITHRRNAYRRISAPS